MTGCLSSFDNIDQSISLSVRYLSMAASLNLVDTRADHVGKSGTHLAALADLPADAHLAFVILFDSEVTLVVTVLTDDNTLEASHGTFTMSFFTKSLFGWGTRHIGGHTSTSSGVTNADSELGVSWSGGGIKLGGLGEWEDLDVLVQDDIVEMVRIAHVDSNTHDVELLGCRHGQ
jgi:hypothetical protein